MKLAGIIYDNSPHYLDHLGPFCALIGCPLIISEKSIADGAKKFYPDLEVLQIDALNLRLPERSITCDSTPLIKAAFPNQSTQNIWLPHGRSDKGFSGSFFEALMDEEVIIVYGPNMEKQLEEKNIPGKKIQIGNFRREYFLKNKKFYKTLVPFSNLKNKILYAPSWDDSLASCSFWKAFPEMARNLPDNVQLILKFHPNTVLEYEPEIEILLGRYSKDNIHVLPDFPPIYPLLDQIDAYIGDMSSIGYDFLLNNGPMFFLNADQNLPLHRCGKAIDPKTFDFPLNHTHSKERVELYNQTFTKEPNFSVLKEELSCAL